MNPPMSEVMAKYSALWTTNYLLFVNPASISSFPMEFTIMGILFLRVLKLLHFFASSIKTTSEDCVIAVPFNWVKSPSTIWRLVYNWHLQTRNYLNKFNFFTTVQIIQPMYWSKLILKYLQLSFIFSRVITLLFKYNNTNIMRNGLCGVKTISFIAIPCKSCLLGRY